MQSESMESLKTEQAGLHDLAAYRQQRFDAYRFKPTHSPEEFRNKAEAYEELGRLGELEHELMEGEDRLYQQWRAEEEAEKRTRETQPVRDRAEAERLTAAIASSQSVFPQRMIPTMVVKREDVQKSSGFLGKMRRFFGSPEA